jgi:hypothetical protein
MIMYKHQRDQLIKSAASMILTLSLALPVCSCSSGASNTKSTFSSSQLEEAAIKKNNRKVHQYIKKMTGFDIEDSYMDGAELMMNSSSSVSQAMICILIEEGKEEDMLNILRSKLGTEQNITAKQIPAEAEHQYADELRHMSFIRLWTASGSGQKVNVYMAKKGSSTYIYIFA